MKLYFVLITFFLPFTIIAQEEEKINKNFVTIDAGYSHIFPNNSFRNATKAGVFQQIQYNRNLHRFIDVYAGLNITLGFPTKVLLSSDLYQLYGGNRVLYTSKQTSIILNGGFNFIVLNKRKVDWKISNDFGYNYLNQNDLAAYGLIVPVNSVLLNSGFILPNDQIYHLFNYGIGTAIECKVSSRFSIGFIYKSNISFSFKKYTNLVGKDIYITNNGSFFTNNLGLRFSLKF